MSEKLRAKGAAVAARVAAFLEKDRPAHPIGVLPLNPGFFQLERMRAGRGACAAGLPPKKVSSR